jgi:hypothetical protein
MSYDYMMFHGPGPWPQWIKRIALFKKGAFGAMGTPEELMGRIGELFPSISWNKHEDAGTRAVFAVLKGGAVDPNAPVWFGGSAPEFQLSADIDGQVKSMQVSRAEPREIRLLCKRLGLVYLDLQSDGLFGMLFR